MRNTRRQFLGAIAGAATAGATRNAFAQQPPQPPTSFPWQRDLLLRASGDGGDTFGPSSLFQAASGVPSLGQDLRGRLFCAFQWFPSKSPYFDKVAVKTSDDQGRSWSDPAPILIDEYPGYSRPFDPTLALLQDGRIRIYFSANTTGSDLLGNTVGTYSAISEDGVHYRFEPGARFTVADHVVIDPAVLRLGDVWHLTAPIGAPQEGAYHAVSLDGLELARVGNIPSVGGVNWTGNLAEHGAGMRFYGTSGRGPWWSYSEDGGRRWTDPVFLDVTGNDPTAIRTQDGIVLMICVG